MSIFKIFSCFLFFIVVCVYVCVIFIFKRKTFNSHNARFVTEKLLFFFFILFFSFCCSKNGVLRWWCCNKYSRIWNPPPFGLDFLPSFICCVVVAHQYLTPYYQPLHNDNYCYYCCGNCLLLLFVIIFILFFVFLWHEGRLYIQCITLHCTDFITFDVSLSLFYLLDENYVSFFLFATMYWLFALHLI